MTESVNDPPADGSTASYLLDAVTLACGAEVDPLIEQVADGHAGDLDAHQRDCVHCQAAIAEFAELWAPVAANGGRAGAGAPRPDRGGHEPDPGPGQRRVVHPADNRSRELSASPHASWQPWPATAPAWFPASASPSAAAPTANSPRSPSRPPSGTAIPTRRWASSAAPPSSTSPWRSRYGDPVHQIAKAIQQHVIAELRDSLGLQTVVVNVTIDDVLTGEDE